MLSTEQSIFLWKDSKVQVCQGFFFCVKFCCGSMVFTNEVKHSTELCTSLGILAHRILYNKCGTKQCYNWSISFRVHHNGSFVNMRGQLKTTGIYELEAVTISLIFLQIFD